METQTPKPVACPVCAKENLSLYQTKNNCDIFLCHACGLRFVYPLPESLDEVYKEDYFAGASAGFGYVDYDADKQPMIEAFEKYLTWIRRLKPDSKSLLDIGTATGFFLELARKRGFNVSGVELSDFAAAKGREKGIDVKTGSIDVVSGTYDSISMLDLIEHVTNPREELKKAHERLVDGGLLVINTPDAGSLYARIMGKHWHLIVPPEHLYYFNRANLARLLRETGFRVRIMTTIGKTYTVPYILRTLHGWLKLGVIGSIANWSSASRFRDVAIPINLRDNMFVIAEKI